MERDEVTKKLYDATNDADRKVVERVGEVAAKRGAARAQVALGWLLSKGVVTAPIIGATKQNHLEDAIGALNLKLTPEEITALEEPYVAHPIVGFS